MKPPRRHELGRSREGRVLEGWTWGEGPLRVSLIAGCHGDEPVGPRALLRWLGAAVARRPGLATRFSFRLAPRANPDALARNEVWWREGAGAGDFAGWLSRRVRELPGDDLEFGFPGSPEGDDGIRPEAAALAAFLSADGPLHLHGSLHGLGVGGGPWFLVEPAWRDRIAPYHAACLTASRAEGMVPHDVDRGGEKGFERLGVGLCSRPDSAAMRRHFLERGESGTASLFRPSSMEYARSLGGDPFTFVTEVPLFALSDPGDPAWSERLGRWNARLARAERTGSVASESAAVEAEGRGLGLVAVPLSVQERLVAAQIEAALALVEREADRRAPEVPATGGFQSRRTFPLSKRPAR